jgi:uncharacterized protein
MTDVAAKRKTERERIVVALKAHESMLRARGVIALALFGSVARGAVRRGSDVDILVEIDPDRPFSLVDLASLKQDLSDLLGRPADVTIGSDLRPFLRDAILAERLPVF